MSNLLKIEALSVRIGTRNIVTDVSVSVGAGEIVGIVGASGSGKTMTALAIMRLLPSAASITGEISLNAEALTQKSEAQMRQIRGRSIGMVFQEPMSALNPSMRIGEQVSETLLVHQSISAVEALSAAREALTLVGLSKEQGALDRYPYELSGGQRQRVAIAMAVAMAPPLLIADEPTTALDVIAQGQLLRLLEDLVRTRNMGLLLVSHDLALIAQLADRIAVMHAGAIVEQGSTRELLRDAQHPYTRALLNAADLKPKRAPQRTIDSPIVLEAGAIVREYPRQRRSLWRKPPPFRAVNDVSLCVRAGETVGLVGESGSGKSSLLRVMLALDRAQSGWVKLIGDDFSSASGGMLRRLRGSIQAVFQDPYGSFDPRWTVERLIAEPFFALDSPPSRADSSRKVAQVLEQVGLSTSDAARFPQEFSGGECQRIAIARALITEPAVIAFDEAVSALDAVLRAQILRLLTELSDRLKVAYLFVTHDLQVIRAIADRVYVMQQGQIVEHGATEELFRLPRHAYTQALIAATPRLPIFTVPS
jgi:peptide/nickel transport system ATP-binding protein